MLSLNENERQVLNAGIQNGIGFTRACQLIGKSPRELSEFVRANPEIFKSVTDSHRRYKQYLLSLATELANRKNISGWLNQIHKLKMAPDKIYMWEDFCKRIEIDKKKLIKAHHIIKDELDTATACGFTYEEFFDYISSDPELDIYFSNPLLK
jgi:hypothetical protein